MRNYIANAVVESKTFINEIDDRQIDFNLRVMKWVCQAAPRDFANLPASFKQPKPTVVDVSKPNDKDDLFYLHFDNGADILGVAHLDSVSEFNHFGYVRFGEGYRRVFSPHLDDRLGAYVLLDLLPRYGVKFDILFTVGEESGQSTAGSFKTEKQYNWIFEFDRTGHDVALYEYMDKPTTDLIEAYGWETTRGSVTDICRLYDLGCKAFNFGVGYHDYHGRYAYAQLPETAASVAKFLHFYREMGDTHLPHTKKVYTTYPKGRWQQGRMDDEWTQYGGASGTTSGVAHSTPPALPAPNEEEEELDPDTPFDKDVKVEDELPFGNGEPYYRCPHCLLWFPTSMAGSIMQFGMCESCLGEPEPRDRACEVCNSIAPSDTTLQETGICHECSIEDGHCVICGIHTQWTVKRKGKLYRMCTPCSTALAKEREANDDSANRI